jgi:hypothetical protein
MGADMSTALCGACFRRSDDEDVWNPTRRYSSLAKQGGFTLSECQRLTFSAADITALKIQRVLRGHLVRLKVMKELGCQTFVVECHAADRLPPNPHSQAQGLQMPVRAPLQPYLELIAHDAQGAPACRRLTHVLKDVMPLKDQAVWRTELVMGGAPMNCRVTANLYDKASNDTGVLLASGSFRLDQRAGGLFSARRFTFFQRLPPLVPFSSGLSLGQFSSGAYVSTSTSSLSGGLYEGKQSSLRSAAPTLPPSTGGALPGAPGKLARGAGSIKGATLCLSVRRIPPSQGACGSLLMMVSNDPANPLISATEIACGEWVKVWAILGDDMYIFASRSATVYHTCIPRCLLKEVCLERQGGGAMHLKIGNIVTFSGPAQDMEKWARSMHAS